MAAGMSLGSMRRHMPGRFGHPHVCAYVAPFAVAASEPLAMSQTLPRLGRHCAATLVSTIQAMRVACTASAAGAGGHRRTLRCGTPIPPYPILSHPTLSYRHLRCAWWTACSWLRRTWASTSATQRWASTCSLCRWGHGRVGQGRAGRDRQRVTACCHGPAHLPCGRALWATTSTCHAMACLAAHERHRDAAPLDWAAERPHADVDLVALARAATPPTSGCVTNAPMQLHAGGGFCADGRAAERVPGGAVQPLQWAAHCTRHASGACTLCMHACLVGTLLGREGCRPTSLFGKRLPEQASPKQASAAPHALHVHEAGRHLVSVPPPPFPLHPLMPLPSAPLRWAGWTSG